MKQKTLIRLTKYALENKRNEMKKMRAFNIKMINNNGVDVCYNEQTVVDSMNKLVVDFEVINNPSDQGQLNKKTSCKFNNGYDIWKRN